MCQLLASVTIQMLSNWSVNTAVKPPSMVSLALASTVTVLADEFSLRERGINSDRLAEGVKAAPLDVVVDQLAEGRKALWH